MRLLALETSCDDTSVAVVQSPNRVLSVCSAGQDQLHQPFGGVVPEIASRNHTLKILPLVERALAEAHLTSDEIDAIAVTSRPGLLGALMVGVATAKALSLGWNKPLVGVNHLVGHLYAPFLEDETYKPKSIFPPSEFLALTVSGGHSAIYHVEGYGRFRLLGKTLDDAAGEAFDKFAKMLGLGYPGGAIVDREATRGNRLRFAFPRPLLVEDRIAFSFSGLKSSAHRMLSQMSELQIKESSLDLCASFQEAVVDCLVGKLDLAQKRTGIRNVVITGGVSANSRLRQRTEEWATLNGLSLEIPPMRFCTDNAAMIGLAGLMAFHDGKRDDQTLSPQPHSAPNDFLLESAHT